MTKLEQAALTTIPLFAAVVEEMYGDCRFDITKRECIKALCESHERLRMELAGAEKIIAELLAACEAILPFAAADEKPNEERSIPMCRMSPWLLTAYKMCCAAIDKAKGRAKS